MNVVHVCTEPGSPVVSPVIKMAGRLSTSQNVKKWLQIDFNFGTLNSPIVDG